MASPINVNKVIATVLTTILPRCFWYKGAYFMAGLMGHWTIKKQKPYKNTFKINHARKLNQLLSLMTRAGKDFPIPVRAFGLGLFSKPRPNGLILCSTHLPLTKLAIGYLAERAGLPMVAIVASPDVTNTIALWGTTKRLPVIPVDQFVLLKAKTILQQRGVIVVLVDKELGGVYSPAIFRLAEKVRSDIVFFEASLHQNKTVEINFYESKWSRQSECVQKQMSELYEHTAMLLLKQYHSEYTSSPC